MTHLLPFKNKLPQIHETVFVAKGSVLIGDVTIGEDSSIWYQSVLRGDYNSISVGSRSNIQDLTIVHTDSDFPTVIGDDVTIGHKVIIHGCEIKNRALIGMGAIIMNGAVIGEEAIVGAGAIVTEGTVIPPRTVAIGSPAKVRRELKISEIPGLKESADHYVQYAREHKKIS